jgi:hypothetical protein
MLEFMQKLRGVGRQIEIPTLKGGAVGALWLRLFAFLQTVSVGIVGGSDLHKIAEQLGEGCERRVPPHSIVERMNADTTFLLLLEGIHAYDYLFAENGLVAYKGGELIAKQSLKAFLGEDKLKTFINFVLHYIADLDIPIKRGTFIEFRNGMLVSLIDVFFKRCVCYFLKNGAKQHPQREGEETLTRMHMLPCRTSAPLAETALKRRETSLSITTWKQGSGRRWLRPWEKSLQIMAWLIPSEDRSALMSFQRLVRKASVWKHLYLSIHNVWYIQTRRVRVRVMSGVIKTFLMQGWDKTYCLQFVQEFTEVHFFGDKTYEVRSWLGLDRAAERKAMYMWLTWTSW